MSSTFAEIVKSQRIDRQGRSNRSFEARALFTLAHRARTNTFQSHKRLTVWQRVRRLWLKLMKRGV